MCQCDQVQTVHIGNIYNALGQYEKALGYQQKAIVIQEKIWIFEILSS